MRSPLTPRRANQSLADFNACVPHGSEGWPFELLECYRRSLSSSRSDNCIPVTHEIQLSKPELPNQLFFKHPDVVTSVPEREPVLLLPLRSGLYARQDLVEGNTIKQPPIGDDGVDFLSVPDVFERVGA